MKKFYISSLWFFVYVILCSLFFLTSISSCIAPKKMVYFQGDSLPSIDTIRQAYVPIIQKNDMLSVVVGSLNPEANEIFNMASLRSAPPTGNGNNGPSVQPAGYLVAGDGSVELPLIGKVKVAGLEVQAAADSLNRRLKKYLKAPSVSVYIINFKVSVLGEVNQPAVYTVADGKITLPEALSLAGDLTIYGKRDNVMIVREENGLRSYTRVDLTSRHIFDSPYYYLHKNDLVYVEPTKARLTGADRTYQVLPLVLSVVTAVSLILFRFL
ncbi:polysaccharide biosynthesis/export family protein [Dyadobacter sp. CY326]|uniref:polysaccharide biosynthesis/export family protein n=1 Tax=Dyadobacter sp. CY326 TaxID=2907300 RepID=UPI001F43F996|nr:polysaccharide biosynthesis/export family protein [Dyadobacter sp. CY326]MCE7066124.1 polysaccharide biosynthesis/export family protein [Dyadobacter sp. CY326]